MKDCISICEISGYLATLLISWIKAYLSIAAHKILVKLVASMVLAPNPIAKLNAEGVARTDPCVLG